MTAEKNKLEEEYREIKCKSYSIGTRTQPIRVPIKFALEEVQKHERIQQANQFEMDELIEAYEQLEEQYVENHEKLAALQKANKALKKELDYLQLSNEDKLNKSKKSKRIARTWDESCSCSRTI